VLWWRHTIASTTSSEFILYSHKHGSGTAKPAEQQSSGQRDLVVTGSRGNLQLLLSARTGRGVNILVCTQSSCAAFCSRSLLQLGAVPIPACRLFDVAVLMSSSHRLLILLFPQCGLGRRCGRYRKMGRDQQWKNWQGLAMGCEPSERGEK
jgi:hypothetical protein